MPNVPNHVLSDGKGSNLQSPSGFTPGPLKKLFADRRDVRFWQVEGIQHSYLYWVRAMMSEEIEPPPFAGGTPLRSVPDYERAGARRVAYDLLARAWSYPSAEMLATFAAPEFAATLSDAWTRLAGDATGVEVVAGLSVANNHALRAGEAVNGQRSAVVNQHLLDSLREQYTRLFYDTYLPCIPPYESVYYNERQVMGKRAGAVIEFYRRAGLAAEGDLPDHIAHECEFIAHLAEEESAAWDAGDAARTDSLRQAQDEFLREHLLPWGVKFCADLARLARGDFYAATARLGSALFNAEWVAVNL